MAKISTSSGLLLVAYIFGTCSFAFGFNAIFNPVFALSLFDLDYPSDIQARRAIDTLILIYAVRDLYMGVATLIAASYKHTKILGWLTLATGSIAVADGAVCYYIQGTGHWNHWPLSPLIFVVGAMFLGVFDSA